MADDLPILVRPASAGDASLVLSSWLKSNRLSNFAKDVATDNYFAEHKLIVYALLERCTVTVACDPSDPDQVYGWMAWERLPGDILVINYAYTKYPFRHLGVARRLYQSINPTREEALVTHTGKAFQDLVKAGYRLVYSPYQLFRLTKDNK